MKVSGRFCKILTVVIATVMMLVSNVFVMAEEIFKVKDTQEIEYTEINPNGYM